VQVRKYTSNPIFADLATEVTTILDLLSAAQLRYTCRHAHQICVICGPEVAACTWLFNLQRGVDVERLTGAAGSL
jgi:hypothetical protein